MLTLTNYNFSKYITFELLYYLSTRIGNLTIVSAIAVLALTAMSTDIILATAKAALGRWVQALVNVYGAILSSESCSIAIARVTVDPVVALSAIFARCIALGVRLTVVDVCLAVNPGEALFTSALRDLT